MKTFIFSLITIIIFLCSCDSKNKKHNRVLLSTSASWRISENKGDTAITLKSNTQGSTAICEVHIYKLNEKETAFEYASKTRFQLLDALYPEIMSEVQETKIGSNKAAGFAWVHSGDDAEYMAFAVKGEYVLSVDFQKMVMKIDEHSMNELLLAVDF